MEEGERNTQPKLSIVTHTQQLASLTTKRREYQFSTKIINHYGIPNARVLQRLPFKQYSIETPFGNTQQIQNTIKTPAWCLPFQQYSTKTIDSLHYTQQIQDTIDHYIIVLNQNVRTTWVCLILNQETMNSTDTQQWSEKRHKRFVYIFINIDNYWELTVKLQALARIETE